MPEISKQYVVMNTEDMDVFYVYLPDHPGPETPGIVRRSVRLSEALELKIGVEIVLDFDENEKLVGLEVIA